ncbi:MAG: hemolysin family protein [Gemmatimonadaceae bacterium]
MDGTPEHLTLGSISLRLLAVIVLVLANGFFVAAEFGLVGARKSRIDALAARGDRSAKAIQQAIAHLDRYISATQLGITLASLGLGWIGKPALASTIDRLFALVGISAPAGVAHSAAAITTAFLIITFLHIVFGELAPKSMALINPEGVSRWVVRPLRWFALGMSPFIAVLNGTANRILRLVGMRMLDESARVHSADELRLLVAQTSKHGLLDESDSAMIAAVLDFHHKKARDVMRPRTEIMAIHIDASEEEVRQVLRSERFSRYPVYGESLDDLVGVFLAKDLWLHDRTTPFSLRRLVRAALFVPDSRAAERVLDDLRKTRAYMAIVLDEYGGTAGILTMEDLVEEVVGEIADEHDLTMRESVEMDGVLELAGSLSLIDVRSDHNLAIPDGSWNTLGGYVFSKLGRLPRMGDRAAFPGGELEVTAMDGRRVAAVRVHRPA